MESGAVEETNAAITAYTQKAFDALANINISESNKQILKKFGENLMKRTV